MAYFERRLDGSLFEQDEWTQALVAVVDQETETARSDELDRWEHHVAAQREAGIQVNALQVIGGGPARAKKWFDYLIDESVLERCETRLGMARLQLLRTIMQVFSPGMPRSHWEILFWMKAFREVAQHNDSLLAEVDAARTQGEVAAESARSVFASAGGNKRAEQLYGAARDIVRTGWRLRGQEFASKAQFARQYVEIVLAETGTEYTVDTIKRWVGVARK